MTSARLLPFSSEGRLSRSGALASIRRPDLRVFLVDRLFFGLRRAAGSDIVVVFLVRPGVGGVRRRPSPWSTVAMIEKLALPEIRELLDARGPATLGEVLNRWLARRPGRDDRRAGRREQGQVLAALEGPLAAQVFEYLDLDDPGATARDVMTERQSAVDPRRDGGRRPDGAARGAPRRARRRGCIALLSPGRAGGRRVAPALQPRQHRPADDARLRRRRKEWTVKHVLDHVRTHGKDSETLNVLYVVDDGPARCSTTSGSATSCSPRSHARRRHHRRQVRRPEGDRRQEDGRRGLPEVRPHRRCR